MIKSRTRSIARVARRYRPRLPVWAALAAPLFLAACDDGAEQVGKFNNDWLGNQIRVEALADPDIDGIVCHFTHFDRGVWDRLSKGNWFEDPSNASIDCQRSGPIELNSASLRQSGEEIFSQRQSLFFKNVAVRRIVDLDNRAVLYVVYSRQLVDGSAKMNLSTVPLTAQEIAMVTPE